MRRVVLVYLVVVGCGGEDEGSPQGQETGPCYPNGTCDAGLVCGSEVCVDLDAVGGETEGEPPGGGGARPGDGGSDGGPGDGGDPDAGDGRGDDGGGTWGEDDAGDPDPTDGGTTIYCARDEDYPDACWCSHSPDWGFADQSCGPAEVGSPALCCASESTWPSHGTCGCSRMYCGQTYDRCFCNTVMPDPNDIPPETAVDTCTAGPEGVCCKDTTTGWCLCWDDVPYCLDEDEVEVGSCSVSSIDCGDDVAVDGCA